MALSLSQINPVTGRIGSSASTSSSLVGSGASVASTLAAQFVKQQASLIYSRYSSSDRVYIHEGIKERAQTLERAARSLFSRNDGESVFDQREVVTSSSDAVSGSADRLTSPMVFSVEVEQVATAQQVVSDNLSDADDNFSDGTESFSITVDGTTFAMSIDIDVGDTNLDVLDAIAAEVNDQASSGVYAEVVSDGTSGESYVSLTAHSTGTGSAFTLSGDVLSGVNLEETTSVDTDAGTGGLLTTAVNAVYAIDGGSSTTSQSNTLSLYSDSVELVLADTTDGEAVTITVQANATEIEEDLETFISAYNDALDFAQSLPSDLTTSYALQLGAAVSPFVSSLESIGIDRATDGSLSIDSDELADAITDGRFARVSASFIGAAGLANSTERASRNLLDGGGEFLTHPANPVDSSGLLAVNRYQNLGMLVDLIA
ncbi:MAG: flagellar hook-associated protein 2 [Myxococcota bacterium]|jgi:flagellar hook-associated protein 2